MRPLTRRVGSLASGWAYANPQPCYSVESPFALTLAADVHSPIAICPAVQVLHEPQLREAWAHLRKASLHYVCMTHEGLPAADPAEARAHIFAYARMMEQLEQYCLLTYNLHTLNCRCVAPASAP